MTTKYKPFDIIGNIQILELIKSNLKLKAKCKCLLCGTVYTRSLSGLDSLKYKCCARCAYDKLQENIIGKEFGKWKVISRVPIDQWRNRHRAEIICKCLVCGKQYNRLMSSIKHRNTHGCRECTQKARNNSGMKKTRLYRIWTSIKHRCEWNSTKNKLWKNYGGRGITICAEWHTFAIFRNWALNNGYADNLSIDRINVNGNYEPSNCRWTNAKVQGNNRRSNHYITYLNRTQSLRMWCDELQINYKIAKQHMQHGESWENFLEFIKQKGNKKRISDITYNGKSQSLKAWCKELNINYVSAKQQHAKGKSLEEIIAYYKDGNYNHSHHIIAYKGKKQSISAWCRELNMPYDSVRSSYYRGLLTWDEIVAKYAK